MNYKKGEAQKKITLSSKNVIVREYAVEEYEFGWDTFVNNYNLYYDLISSRSNNNNKIEGQ
jgi:hypothetical protein